MTDYLGEAAAAPEDWEPPARERTWGHPATLAVLSFALGCLCLMGTPLFRGLSYTLAFAPDEDTAGGISFDDDSSSEDEEEDEGTPGFIVAGAFLSAAFSLAPLALGLTGLRREAPDLAKWVAPLLRAGVALSAVSLVLRLVQAVIVTTRSDADGPGLFSYLGLLL
jgi:hypothetical protein